MCVWTQETQSLLKPLGCREAGQGRNTEVRRGAWYSHGSPALRHSHCGQLHFPDEGVGRKKMGNELLSRDTLAPLLCLSLSLMSPHPKSWDTPSLGAGLEQKQGLWPCGPHSGHSRASCQRTPRTLPPLEERADHAGQGAALGDDSRWTPRAGLVSPALCNPEEHQSPPALPRRKIPF